MGSMLPYIAYMDPMGMTIDVDLSCYLLSICRCSPIFLDVY